MSLGWFPLRRSFALFLLSDQRHCHHSGTRKLTWHRARCKSHQSESACRLYLHEWTQRLNFLGEHWRNGSHYYCINYNKELRINYVPEIRNGCKVWEQAFRCWFMDPLVSWDADKSMGLQVTVVENGWSSLQVQKISGVWKYTLLQLIRS